ncbi:transglutaminase TgpA family protein [Chitinolyticbacter meiyuanensis]|uniref:transglutaminase TgpA family protein n=1 Tax=Chitinolyticbacter meiyuanensis TaxID=682798 RepID=UPI001651F92E|nr:DUF3488 and transglutaminase-like domain-containing protein [Chitinolyticbacter meiyuanensis]
MSATLQRNKLLALIAVLALVIAPHLWAMPIWLAMVMAAPLVWRAAIAWSGRRMPGRTVRVLLALLLMALVFWQFRTLVGRDGGVALLVALASLKLLETSRPRDVRILALLGYFVTGTLFLLSQSFWMLAYAGAVALALSGQLFAWQRRDAPIEAEEYRRASRMLLEGLPIALLLFVLFPRLSGPLWSMPQDKAGASTGISDTMTPGSFSDLTLDDSVAFRVDFIGRNPERHDLYWRGPVYERYDGKTWFQRQYSAGPVPVIVAQGQTLRYTMTHEPQDRNWLFALDVPTALPQDARLSNRLQALAARPIVNRQRFDFSSAPHWRIRDDASAERALQLPEAGNPRARALAAQWREHSPEVRVAKALQWLRDNGFVYSLAPPLLDGPDPVDQLLYRTREGFCEHYAGAFTFLMRAAGVPARVVGGYLGGEYNPTGNYWIVRQADAHAWSEVWLEGKGWQRVDPTAVVSPMRIDGGLARSVRNADRLPLLLRENAAWLAEWRQQWDSVIHVWNRWVIGYDAQQQLQLLNRLGIDYLGSRTYVLWVAGAFCTLLLLFAVAMQWQARKRPTDAASRHWQRFIQRLARHGVAPRIGESPTDLAARAGAVLPMQRSQIDAIASDYLAARYGESVEALTRLAAAVQRFKPRP